MGQKQWESTIYYRTSSGLLDVEFGHDEISDLYDLEEFVERGPSFEAIERIVTTYGFSDGQKTVEQAEAE